MNKEPYYFIIPLYIYPFDIMISVNEDDNLLKQRLLENGNTEEEIDNVLPMRKTSRGRTFTLLATNQTVIRLVDDGSDLSGVIAHESFHATTFILERVGVSFDLNVSDEAYSYLLQYIVEKITETLDA